MAQSYYQIHRYVKVKTDFKFPPEIGTLPTRVLF